MTGERDGADFEDALACYQAKSRRAIPGWLWTWLSGIQGTARARDKAGVLVLHRPGQARDAAQHADGWLLEEARAWAVGAGVVREASDPRAWGAVIRRLRQAGTVRAVGARVSQSNACLKPTWGRQ